MSYGVAGDGSGPDRVLDEAAESGWGLLELPARHTPRTDPEAVRAVALVVRRALDRGAVTVDEQPGGPSPLTADRIAVGTAHRDQAAAVRAALSALGVTGVTVDTANRLQGREYDLTVVLHPCRAARTRRPSTWRRAGSASWPPGTGTPAWWWPGRG